MKTAHGRMVVGALVLLLAPVATAAPSVPAQPVFDVPKLEGIALAGITWSAPAAPPPNEKRSDFLRPPRNRAADQ